MNPFHDPLERWPNDDLLIEQASRNELAKIDERLLKVFYWHDLGSLFKVYDEKAIRGKKYSRQQGFLSVVLTGVGVVLLTISTDLPSGSGWFLTVSTLIAMFLGGFLAALHWWGVLTSREGWLLNRLRCERLRQLHFQSILNNFDLVCSAYHGASNPDQLNDTDPELHSPLKQFEAIRKSLLSQFQRDFDDAELQRRHLIDDNLENHCWMRPEWAQPCGELNNSHEKIFEALRWLRIGVQWKYAHKNLGGDMYSSKARERVAGLVIACCAIGVTLCSGLGLLAAFTDPTPLSLSVGRWTQVAAVLSAVALIVQTLKQGFQTKADAERYGLYAKKLEAIRADFDIGNPQGKLSALRELEAASYHELRNFLTVHSQANFLT